MEVISATSGDAMPSVRHIFDLHEDLIVNICAQVVNASDLCCIAATCTTFARLILRDAQTAAIAWAKLMSNLITCETLHATPSAELYRAVSIVRNVSWHPLDLKVARADPRMILLGGRTGSATCCLGGNLLLYGGTLNGNFGPVLGDLLQLAHSDDGSLAVWPASCAGEDAWPGARRGHTMTASALCDGEAVACIIGGWGDMERAMAPVLLHQLNEPESEHQYAWSEPETSGAEPEGRAFHSTSEVARCTLLVYGGLGNGCCRTDVAVLDLARMQWSVPRVGGSPRCRHGRAGHGACFFPGSSTHQKGELLLVSGATRSSSGDAHQGTLDVLEVTATESCDDEGRFRGIDASFEWSHDRSWGNIRLPEVRTATYAVFGRSVLCWGGISEDHGAQEAMHVIDTVRRTVREADVDSDNATPPARGGAVAVQISPVEALFMCGSDSSVFSLSEMRAMATPYTLRLQLPSSIVKV